MATIARRRRLIASHLFHQDIHSTSLQQAVINFLRGIVISEQITSSRSHDRNRVSFLCSRMTPQTRRLFDFSLLSQKGLFFGAKSQEDTHNKSAGPEGHGAYFGAKTQEIGIFGYAQFNY